jgi:hypothetical protein
MVETLFILLTAHFLGDFVLQTEWVVQRKKQLKVQLMHAALVTMVSALMLGSAHMTLLAILFFSHLAMDTLKVYLLPNGIYMFLVDQLVHIGVMCALAYTFSSEAQNGFWLTWLSVEKQRWYLLIVTFLGGFLLCVPVGGVLIGIVIRPLLEQIKEDRRKHRGKQRRNGEQQPGEQGQREQEYNDVVRSGDGTEGDEDHEDYCQQDDRAPEDDVEGLSKGGRYIGWLERSLVMMLLLIGQASGIGFLFAAKSILRFGEIKDSHQRKMAEYIIIGTFLSFGWALITSYLTQQALRLWHQ